MKVFKPREDEFAVRRNTGYLAIDKYPSVPGLISCVMGVAGIVLLLLLFILSYVNKGMAGIWIGVLGILGMLLGIVAIGIAAIGMKDPEALHTRNVIGMIGNGLLLLIYIILYAVGL